MIVAPVCLAYDRLEEVWDMGKMGGSRRLASATALASVAVAAASLAAAASAVPKPKCLIVNERTEIRYPTLQAANDAAATVSGDTVNVKGTCFGTTALDKSLTIAGKSNPGFGVATLDGVSDGTVVTIKPGTSARISDLTIAHGRGDAVTAIHGAGNSGGGIFVDRASLTLTNTHVMANTAGNGGGIYNNLGSLTLVDSVVSGNTADSVETPFEFVSYRGGGIFNGGCHPFVDCSSQASLMLVNSRVAGNSGGGIVNGYAGSVTLDGSTVSGNTGTQGGGILTHGHVTLSDTAITDNVATAGSGGGLFVGRFGAASLTSVVIARNAASGDGGGIAVLLGGVALVGSTVSDNTATSHGGGILSSGAGVSLTGSTVTHNRLTSATASGGGIYSEDAGLTLVASTVTGNIPDDAVEVSL